MDLNDKVTILTGASRGLGVYMAERLARRGSHLALAARGEEDLKATASKVKRFGTNVITVPTDVTKRADLKNLVKRTASEVGPPDVLVNNAGVEKLARFHEMDPGDIEWVIKTNVVSVEVLTRLVLPHMVERRTGHIVNIGSLAGKSAVPYNTVYSSSKHALIGFSWSLREELRPLGIGVSVVCPTFVSEAGMFASWSRGERPPTTPGMVSPEDVADATVKAIEKNKAEIVLARNLGLLTDVAHAISPDLAMAVGRRSGTYRFLEKAIEDDDRAQAH